MSDPQAALAEALHFAFYERQSCNCTKEDLECLAAAILAALPPDWCGHNAAWVVATHGRIQPIIEQAATIVTLRAALDGLIEAAQEVIAADGAIARQELGADQRWDAALAVLDAVADSAALAQPEEER